CRSLPPTLSRALHPSLFLTDPAPTETYTLSLHDALPICLRPADAGGDHGGRDGQVPPSVGAHVPDAGRGRAGRPAARGPADAGIDRKSTRLNSSHVKISYAVFCLKKKKTKRKAKTGTRSE